jgi:hypothetical protein
MGAIATFDYAAWVARYPEFTSVGAPLATQYWNEATLYHANDGSGPVTTVGAQQTLLNMVTAHIAARYATLGGTAPSPMQPPGRISSASEGSVSASFDLNVPAGSAQWWAQSKYGLDYWTAMAPYRRMRYRPGPRRVFQPWPAR